MCTGYTDWVPRPRQAFKLILLSRGKSTASVSRYQESAGGEGHGRVFRAESIETSLR